MIHNPNAAPGLAGADRQLRLKELAQQLIDTEAEIEQLSNGQIDAIVSPTVGPILLRDARESLRISEQRFRAVFDNALEAMLVVDNDGHYIDVNPAACSLFGLSHSKLLGRRIEDFAGPEENVTVNWKDLQSAGEMYREFVLVRSDGSQRITEFSVVTGIMPGCHLSILRDVTTRRGEEEQLRQSNQTLQQVTDTVAEGLVFIDGEQRIRLTNAAATEYLARLTATLLGDRLTHLGSQPILSLLAPPPAGQLYHEVMIEQPTRTIFAVIATPIQADFGADSYVLVLRDVTEERRLQRHALQQDRLAAIGELAAGIAHDFNNILTPILLYTDMTMNRMAPESRAWSNLRQVLGATQRAKSLVAQILAFSRETTEQRQPVEVGAVIEEVLKLMRAVLPSTIEIRQELDLRPHTILADPTQVHQVLMNLCTNAYHAMRAQGGVLTIGLDAIRGDADFAAQHGNLPAGEYVRLTVSDTGHGMEPATLERIFDPFFTTKPVGEGTGMGLAVVYGIITDYGGSISVASQPGEGTTLQIYLPQFDGHVQVEESTERSLLPGTERLLLIDDEEAIALVTKQILESLGYQVTAQSNSVEAVAIFRSAPDQFDLIITDLTMPRMTGIEVAGEMLRIRPDLPILLISGTGQELTPAMVESFGFRALLSKPFTPSELSWSIRQILDQEL